MITAAGIMGLGMMGAETEVAAAKGPVVPGPTTVPQIQDYVPEATPPQEAPRSAASRSSRRSRYPGPVPTPEEWEPPEGKVRIGLQAGHWKANEAPRELSGLRENGTAWNGTQEWEVNVAIAEKTAELLKEAGYEVDLLPAVVPPGYRAHLFIAIHADGSNDPNATGYRVATPRRDATGRAAQFAELLNQSYGEATSIRRLPTVTRRMRNYYAFNFRRYEHALHPMTIGVIIETGFMTSARDRRVILDEPERAAQGIVDAIKLFPVTPPPDTASQSPEGPLPDDTLKVFRAAGGGSG